MKSLNRFSFLLILGIINIGISKGQTIIETPNFGSKTHPTLLLDKIERNNSVTRFFFTVTNFSPQGDWFCVDQSVSITETGTVKKLQILSASGIARCPETFKFTFVEEQLQFVLEFPPLSPNVKYIDLVENCSNACFSFKGLMVDPSINTELNAAYDAYSQGSSYKALTGLKSVLEQIPDYPYGFIYLNIIEIYYTLKQPEEALKWEEKLRQSNAVDKEFLLSQIKR